MATFIMLGKYTPQALADLSPQRTDKAVALIKKYKGELVSMYAALGENDLVLILEFPGVEEAMKASIALTKMSGIAFNTSPILPVEEFDKLTAKL
ncbi:MAG: GYD domain-containing protein [Thermoguttaceae bacterium]